MAVTIAGRDFRIDQIVCRNPVSNSPYGYYICHDDADVHCISMSKSMFCSGVLQFELVYRRSAEYRNLWMEQKVYCRGRCVHVSQTAITLLPISEDVVATEVVSNAVLFDKTSNDPVTIEIKIRHQDSVVCKVRFFLLDDS
ncbi:hypothetical protein Zmor_016055 [Zophobas morio]|uniref:Uncharacterized protein n=1 Tax=Zophobas morio TaxID=2755281 RepID=A0AA38MH65_9CUCU|nr:hypothetical protein Zmor_016055 [Zophobas morio]